MQEAEKLCAAIDLSRFAGLTFRSNRSATPGHTIADELGFRKWSPVSLCKCLDQS
jgi:hypothetical protein